MRPRPRLRKTIKWAGAAATVVLVVVWIGSGWRVGGARYESLSLRVMSGGIVLEKMSGVGRLRYLFTDIQRFTWHWSPAWYRSVGPNPRSPGGPQIDWQLSVPTWGPVLGVLTLTMIAWRLDALARRRARLALCANCHYDRTGLAPGAVCPECGRSPG